MDYPTFHASMERQLNRCREILDIKGAEYAPVDRFHNFRVSAAFLGGTKEQALGGFMAKHTTSLYDMIRSGDTYPRDVWIEKITDHMNYLILLMGMVDETYPEEPPVFPAPPSEDPPIYYEYAINEARDPFDLAWPDRQKEVKEALRKDIVKSNTPSTRLVIHST